MSIIKIKKCFMCGKIGKAEDMLTVVEVKTDKLELQHEDCYYGQFSDPSEYDNLDFPA
jgi:predicted RNA-binding protein YlxR (DUF448 family)